VKVFFLWYREKAPIANEKKSKRLLWRKESDKNENQSSGKAILSPGQTGNVWRPNSIKHCLLTKHFTVWTPCLVLFDRVWSCLIKFEGHQTFDQNRKIFLLFSCLMGDVLFVWTASYQTCLIRACVPSRLLSGLYQLFDLCLIKHVSTVWPLTLTFACLVTKQCLMMFGRQTFHVCTSL